MRKIKLLFVLLCTATLVFAQVPPIENGGGTLTEIGADLIIGNSRPGAGGEGDWLMVIGADLMFIGEDAINGQELWMLRADGTEELLMDINPGTDGSDPTKFCEGQDGRVYFAANDGTNGTELWVTDGTTAGTMMVMNLNPVAGEGSDPIRMAAFGTGIIYDAKDAAAAAAGEHDLFYCDGTTITVVKRGIKLVNGGNGESRHRYTASSPDGKKAFFVADDGIHGEELWVTDGTTEGTHLVLDIGFRETEPGSGVTINTRYEHQYMVNNEQILFRAFTDAWWVNQEDTYEWINNTMWVSDGTALGTYCLGDYFKSPDAGDPTKTSHPICNYLKTYNGMVVMRAKNELGTHLVGTDLSPELYDESGVAVPGTGMQLLKIGNGPNADGNPENTWFQAALVWDSMYFSPINHLNVSPDIDNKDTDGNQIAAGREMQMYDSRTNTMTLLADFWGPTDGLQENNDMRPWPASANRRIYFPGRAEAASLDDAMYYMDCIEDDPTHTPKILFNGEGSITKFYQETYGTSLAIVTRSASDVTGDPDIVHLYVYDDGLDKTNAITANGDARDVPVYDGPGSSNRTGIRRAMVSEDIKVFPNPVSDAVTVTMDQERAETIIFDMTGQMVWQGVIYNNRSMDVSRFSAGLYVMKIRTDKGVKSAKLVITK